MSFQFLIEISKTSRTKRKLNFGYFLKQFYRTSLSNVKCQNTEQTGVHIFIKGKIIYNFGINISFVKSEINGIKEFKEIFKV